MSHSSMLTRVLAWGSLCLIALVLMVPLGWMVLTSVKSDGDLRAVPAVVVPTEVKAGNYREVLGPFHFLVYARNSLLVAGLTVLGSVLSSAVVAYGFAKIKF